MVSLFSKQWNLFPHPPPSPIFSPSSTHPSLHHGGGGLFDDYLRYWQTRTPCCGHIVADTFVSPFARSRNICCGHKFCVRDTKMFLILFRNILCPLQMFPSLRSPRNIMSNNVSATMYPRLPVPLIWCLKHRETGLPTA